MRKKIDDNVINRNEFLKNIAKENGLKTEDVRQFYEIFVKGIVDNVCDGKSVSLTGFGTFSLKKHKGHPVQFEAAVDEVKDYVVLKFAASNTLTAKIRKIWNERKS